MIHAISECPENPGRIPRGFPGSPPGVPREPPGGYGVMGLWGYGAVGSGGGLCGLKDFWAWGVMWWWVGGLGGYVVMGLRGVLNPHNPHNPP